MSWYRKPHWRILVALALGLVYGVVAATAGWREFTADWIAPFGTIFLRLLLLIAVPLVLASLITGIASLSDLKKLSRIGGKTIGIYVGTTLIALIIGLTLVNLLQPGARVPDSVRDRLQEEFQNDVTQRERLAESAGFEDVSKFTTFLVRPEDIPAFSRLRREIFAEIYPNGSYPTNTLVVVQQLPNTDWRLEIDAIAALR